MKKILDNSMYCGQAGLGAWCGEPKKPNFIEQWITKRKEIISNSPIHGNWCGGNWTGGHTHPYYGASSNYYKKPIDYLDNACMKHDMCFADCRNRYPCDVELRGICMNNCNSILTIESLVPNKSPIDSFTIILGMWPNANPGNNSCYCQ